MNHKVLVFPAVDTVSFENRSIPRCKPGECLVRNRYTMISPGTELALLNGTHVGFSDPEISWARYPIEPGYAAVGEVVESASDSGPEPGRSVLYYGPHAEFGVLQPDKMVWTAVPEPPDSGRSILRYLPVRFAQIALTAVLARAWESRHVLVYGAGIVGNLCAQLFTHVSGVEAAGVVDPLDSRRSIAGECGLTSTLSPDEVASWVRDTTGGAGPDTIVEATGVPRVVAESVERVAPRGQVLLLGSTRGTVELNAYKHIHRKLVALIGSHESLLPERGTGDHLRFVSDVPQWLRAVSRQEALEHLVAAVSSGTIRTEPFVQEVISTGAVRDAYMELRDHPNEHLGMVIDWHDS